MLKRSRFLATLAIINAMLFFSFPVFSETKVNEITITNGEAFRLHISLASPMAATLNCEATSTQNIGVMLHIYIPTGNEIENVLNN